MRDLIAVVTAVAVLAGCAGGGPHVALWAPPPHASSAERHAAYHALRPVETKKHTPFFLSKDSRPGEYLVLGDGRHLWQVGDMIAVVDPDSTTGRAARAHDRARSRKTLSVLLVSGSMALGAGLLIGGIQGSDRGGDPPVPAEVTIPLGAVVMVGGIATGITLLIKSSNRQGQERKKALEAYDGDLRGRLRLCTVAGVIADCPPGGP